MIRQNPRQCCFIVDQTTAIVPLRQDSKELDTNAPMYDLLGQQVSSSYRGIVIQNGKKFVVK